MEKPTGDLTALANEVESLAFKHARNTLEKYLNGTVKIQTVGTAAIGTAGNLIHPGLGSTLGGALSALQWIKKERRPGIRWRSLFVIDARKHGDSSRRWP
jgi:hypothetical protein